MEDDVSAFVRARLTDWESKAEAATPGPWAARNVGRRAGLVAVDQAGSHRTTARTPTVSLTLTNMAGQGSDAVHIAEHDPARVLRQVEALGAIASVALAAIDSKQVNDERDQLAYETLLRIATIWQDHEDYREEWAP